MSTYEYLESLPFHQRCFVTSVMLFGDEPVGKTGMNFGLLAFTGLTPEIADMIADDFDQVLLFAKNFQSAVADGTVDRSY